MYRSPEADRSRAADEEPDTAPQWKRRPTSTKQRREDWHNNLGPLKTPQLPAALHETYGDILDSNAGTVTRQGAVALDGFPGLGSQAAVEAFAKEFHRREIRRRGIHPGRR